MGSILDALAQLFTRWGFTLRRAQWLANFAIMGYVGLCVLCIFLSSWGLQEFIWLILAIYTIGALCIMFSPVLWGAVAGTAYATGQFGGRPGMSFDDGVAEVTKWGKLIIDKIGLIILFYGALPFVYTGVVDTGGWEKANLIGLVILPMVIFAALKLWPDGEKVFTVLSYLLIALLVIVLAGTVFNTVQRSVADPASREVQEYREQLQDRQRSDDAKLAKLLRSKLEAGTKLTAEEQQAWDILNRQEQEQSITSQATQFVTGAKITDGSWWQNHWYKVVAAIAITFIGYRLFKRKSAPAGVATTAAPAAPAAGKTAGMFSLGWWWEILIVGILSVVATIYWLTGPGYYDKASLTMRDRNAGEICGLSQFPKNQRFMFVALGRKRGEIPVRITDGTRESDSDLASSLMVEGAKQMRPFLPPQGEHCLRYQHAIESGHDYKFASTMTLNLMFVPYYENPFMKWVIGLYY